MCFTEDRRDPRLRLKTWLTPKPPPAFIPPGHVPPTTTTTPYPRRRLPPPPAADGSLLQPLNPHLLPATLAAAVLFGVLAPPDFAPPFEFTGARLHWRSLLDLGS